MPISRQQVPLVLAALLPVLALAAPQSIDPAGKTIDSRFLPPPGFARQAAPDGSFAAFLRRLPLKPDGAQVRLYDGRLKPDRGVYAAVVDLAIGRRDLHQCADAVIRLRAEYLFAQRRFDEIRFRFSSGFLAEYSRWRRGERIVVNGDRARWQPTGRGGDDAQDLWRYLETVFTYAGTASLARELELASGAGPAIGDVFIQPGHPGHAVIVVDRVVDPASGRALFLIAQSYMPAQELQVLRNPNDAGVSPWYAAGFGATLRTPEWTFSAGDRRRFRE
jgi:hypothetical protein